MAFATLEIGAGNDAFARKFLADACVSDILYHPTLDTQCDAYALPFAERCFVEVFSCNPHGYGFRGKSDAMRLLEEVKRILTLGGRFVIIGNRSNPYCRDLSRIRQWASEAGFQVNLENLNTSHEYPEHTFRRIKDGHFTIPNVRIVLTKL